MTGSQKVIGSTPIYSTKEVLTNLFFYSIIQVDSVFTVKILIIPNRSLDMIQIDYYTIIQYFTK